MAAQESAAGTTNQVMRVRYGDVGDSNFALHGRALPLLVGLFTLLVTFVVLCLYFRWVCGGHRQADLEASSSAAAASSVLPGLDADAINRLPVTLYSPARSTREKGGSGEEGPPVEAECSICISVLVAGDKVKALPPCGHRFHPDCVDDWLRSHPSCPLCRSTLLPVTVAAKQDAVAVNDSPV